MRGRATWLVAMSPAYRWAQADHERWRVVSVRLRSGGWGYYAIKATAPGVTR